MGLVTPLCHHCEKPATRHWRLADSTPGHKYGQGHRHSCDSELCATEAARWVSQWGDSIVVEEPVSVVRK